MDHHSLLPSHGFSGRMLRCGKIVGMSAMCQRLSKRSSMEAVL